MKASSMSIPALYSCRVRGAFGTALGRLPDSRNMKAENGSASLGRFEVYRSVMPLQDLIGLRQTDAAAFILGCEIEFENILVHVLRNPSTLIANFGNDV